MARSHTLRALRKSFWDSSHEAYCGTAVQQHSSTVMQQHSTLSAPSIQVHTAAYDSTKRWYEGGTHNLLTRAFKVAMVNTAAA